jgi:hypothetical protein
MVNHDDNADFAIPDTCYFVAPALMLAAELDPERAAVAMLGGRPAAVDR